MNGGLIRDDFQRGASVVPIEEIPRPQLERMAGLGDPAAMRELARRLQEGRGG